MPDPRFFLTAPPITAAEAARRAGAGLARDDGKAIARAASVDEADLSGAVVFAEGPREIAALGARIVGLCLTTEAHAMLFKGSGSLATMAAPKLGFARVAASLHQSRPFDRSDGQRPKSLGKGVRIHETATIASGVEIAEGVEIGPGAAIGPGVVLGADCIVGANVVITHAIVGARTVLLAGAVIGEAGFGFAQSPEGSVRMPQLGRVIIGADVEIGANSCVDRGALGDTVIGDGVKIDNLVQIGHNCVIGAGTVIAAQTGVSGSVAVGAGVLMGGQVGMADHLVIGEGAQLAAQSGVMRHVPPGEKWAGTPAKPVKTWFREITLLAKLAAKKKQDGDAQD